MKAHSIHGLKIFLSFAAGLACFGLSTTAQAADDASVKAFSSSPLGDPPAAWKFATLPNKSPTKFSIVDLGGARVLKVEAEDSYGNLVHAVQVKPGARTSLVWRWRVDKLIESADLTVRAGEDSPAKVCVSFAFDREKLPFGERARLTLAKSATGEEVPTQTLCYVWDNKLAVGAGQVSVFTKRLRFIVLQTGTGKLGQWVSEKRDVTADHQRMFGDESEGKVPDIVSIVVSADSDNTHGSSLAYVGDITLVP
jgi:hypothetical protein